MLLGHASKHHVHRGSTLISACQACLFGEGLTVAQWNTIRKWFNERIEAAGVEECNLFVFIPVPASGCESY